MFEISTLNSVKIRICYLKAFKKSTLLYAVTVLQNLHEIIYELPTLSDSFLINQYQRFSMRIAQARVNGECN